MHGVPAQLKALRDFIGTRLIAADDLENIVYFRFAAGDARTEFAIGVEGAWELRSVTGELVASGEPSIGPEALATVLESSVLSAETRPPRSIALRFASGHTLEIFDSSKKYESFCIPHGNVYV